MLPFGSPHVTVVPPAPTGRHSNSSRQPPLRNRGQLWWLRPPARQRHRPVTLAEAAEASVSHTVSSGRQHSQRCFPAEQPGRGAALWRGEQPTGCPAMVSSSSRGMAATRERSAGDGLLLVPSRRCPRQSTPCPRVAPSANTCVIPAEQDARAILVKS